MRGAAWGSGMGEGKGVTYVSPRPSIRHHARQIRHTKALVHVSITQKLLNRADLGDGLQTNLGNARSVRISAQCQPDSLLIDSISYVLAEIVLGKGLA